MTGIAYSQIWKMTEDLKNFGLVLKKKSGRTMILSLSNEGREVAQHIFEVLRVVNKVIA
jgi:predicted transcriptional regulator